MYLSTLPLFKASSLHWSLFLERHDEKYHQDKEKKGARTWKLISKGDDYSIWYGLHIASHLVDLQSLWYKTLLPLHINRNSLALRYRGKDSKNTSLFNQPFSFTTFSRTECSFAARSPNRKSHTKPTPSTSFRHRLIGNHVTMEPAIGRSSHKNSTHRTASSPSPRTAAGTGRRRLRSRGRRDRAYWIVVTRYNESDY